MKGTAPIPWLSGGARALLAAALCALSVSCSSDRTVTKKQVRKDPWNNDETFSVGKDKDGNPVMKSDKRSSLEGKRSHFAGNRDFSGKEYTAKSYRKKRWGGNTRFGRKEYQGNTDASRYKLEPWFVQNRRAPRGNPPAAATKPTR